MIQIVEKSPTKNFQKLEDNIKKEELINKSIDEYLLNEQVKNLLNSS